MITKKEMEGFSQSYLCINNKLKGEACFRKVLNLTHIDHDGDFSYGVLETMSVDNNISIYPYRTDYTINIDDKELTRLIECTEEVWITDLNLSFDVLDCLVKKNPHIKWFYVDHHQRKMDDEVVNDRLDKLFAGYRYAPSNQDYGYSACYHVYDILKDVLHDSFGINQTVLNLISDRDTWKLYNKDRVDAFHYGLLTTNFDCSTVKGKGNLKIALQLDSEHIESTIDQGNTIIKYNKNYNSIICKNLGFEFNILTKDDIIAYKGFCVSNFGSSDMFGDLIYKYDVCCLLKMTPGDGAPIYTVSLYSAPNSNVDCSLICSMFGGGGHFHAAGFVTKSLLVSGINGMKFVYKGKRNDNK